MDVLHPKCAGLDVHQQTVVAGARTGAGKTVTYHIHTFGTTTPQLLALSDWLTAPGCPHVAMEWRVIVAEIGVDMTRFPTAAHLVSGAGLGPRSHERAGQR